MGTFAFSRRMSIYGRTNIISCTHFVLYNTSTKTGIWRCCLCTLSAINLRYGWAMTSWRHHCRYPHYCDVTMGSIASLTTSLTSVYSTVQSGADQRKHQSSASLAFVWGSHRRPVNSQHKWPVTRKMLSFADVIMLTAYPYRNQAISYHLLKTISIFLESFHTLNISWYTTIEQTMLGRTVGFKYNTVVLQI